MRLYNVKVRGFRRFDDEQNLNVTTKLTAIVGPNEAGKTSLLRAIGYFADKSQISPQDISHFNRNEVSLRLSFFLDEDDLDVADLEEPSWFDLVKSRDGNITYDIRPRPKRNLLLRSKLSKAIDKVISSPNVLKSILDHSDEGTTSLEAIKKILSSSTKLSDDNVTKLTDFSQIIQSTAETNTYSSLHKCRDLAEELLKFEEEHNPLQNGVNVLAKRVPQILNFTHEYRDIVLPYDISSYDNPDPNSRQLPSKPLSELIRLSGLDIIQLKEAISNSIAGVKAGILADANVCLAELCRSAWKQSDAALQFSVDGYQLNVLVRNEKDFEIKDQFSDYSSRSDGYKQFVALQIFTFLQKSSKSILLIDEIEHHLHYDAQADLIQILQAEKTIGNVIYTTHSAGSLPEDLGVGVRMVHWCDTDKRISHIQNKFWYKNDDQGFKPILFGMGAATLAFFPTRRALISEGPTELILMPSILRQSLSVDSLDFQIVHGLSNINPTGLPMLDASGNRVCYLTDNDDGGRTIRDGLKAAGVPQSHIFSVSDINKSIITTEDLLEESIWSTAVNEYIRMYGESRGIKAELNSFPEYGRINALPEAIRKEKVSFSYNILDIIRTDPNRRLVKKKYDFGLVKFNGKVKSAFEIGTSSS